MVHGRTGCATKETLVALGVAKVAVAATVIERAREGEAEAGAAIRSNPQQASLLLLRRLLNWAFIHELSGHVLAGVGIEKRGLSFWGSWTRSSHLGQQVELLLIVVAIASDANRVESHLDDAKRTN